MEKMDQTESDLGMRSDVLGTVLEDYDVEGAIMDAVTGERDSKAVQEDIEETIEERKEAVDRIEKEFLIRDKFDGSDHNAIENLIDLSEEKPIGEDEYRATGSAVLLHFRRRRGYRRAGRKYRERTLPN